MSNVLRTNKMFGQFLKFVSINGLLESAVVSFNKEGEDNIYCKVRNPEQSLIAETCFKFKNSIKSDIGIFNLDLLRRIFTSIGPDIEIEFEESKLILKSDHSTYHYLLCNPDVLSNVLPEKVKLKDTMKFSVIFKVTKDNIDKILNGMGLIDDSTFTVMTNKTASEKAITLQVGTETSNNFRYELEGTVNSDIRRNFNKEYLQTILGMLKGLDEITVKANNNVLCINVEDKENYITATFILPPRVEEAMDKETEDE